MCAERSTTLSPASAEMGMKVTASGCAVEGREMTFEVVTDLVEAPLLMVDEIHLVDGDDEVRDPQE